MWSFCDSEYLSFTLAPIRLSEHGARLDGTGSQTAFDAWSAAVGSAGIWVNDPTRESVSARRRQRAAKPSPGDLPRRTTRTP